MSYFITMGCEVTLLQRNTKSFNIVITPEIMYLPRASGEESDVNYWASLGIGLNTDFKKLFGIGSKPQ